MQPEIISTSIVNFDNLGLTTAAEKVQALSQQQEFSFVVTPNMDHLSRLCDHSQKDFFAAYQQAGLTLCDSRIINALLTVLGKPVDSVVPGSDLTQYLFEHILDASHRILVFGGDDDKIELLKKRYPFLVINHINPSMGFIDNDDEVLSLLEQIESLQPEFIFLSVGSPRQEMFAQKLKERGIQKGVALCVGASINFITGVEKRAPGWMQHLGMEWFYRMMQDPGRLAKRYGMNAVYLPKILFKLAKQP